MSSRKERFGYNNFDFNVLGTIFRQQIGRDIFIDFKNQDRHRAQSPERSALTSGAGSGRYLRSVTRCSGNTWDLGMHERRARAGEGRPTRPKYAMLPL